MTGVQTCALPIFLGQFALLLGVYLPARLPWWVTLSLGWSLLAAVAGTQIGVGSDNVLRTIGAWLRHGPRLPAAGGAAAYGLLLLLAGLLAMIWWPRRERIERAAR